MPQIDPRVSLGNVLTVVAFLVSTGVLWGATQAEIKALHDRAEAQAKTLQEGRIERTQALAGHEGRIRALEAGAARDGARLDAILQALTRIEARLDRTEVR